MKGKLFAKPVFSTAAIAVMMVCAFLPLSTSAQMSDSVIAPTDTLPAPVVKDTVQAPKDTVVIEADTRFFYNEFNAIEYYDKQDMAAFFDKWNAEPTTKLVVAHFGDSHIQPGIYSDEVRRFMQTQRGDGGIGMIFPYTAARTYPPYNYKTAHYGKWLFSKALEPRPKLPLGVTGMTIRTVDPAAGFMIHFRERIPSHYKKLKLFFKPGPSSFDFRVVTANSDIVINASQLNAEIPFVEIVLPDTTNSIHVQLLKANDQQTSFEFYGMSLESDTDHGLIYHSLGVGGAPYTSVLEQVMIDAQLPVLQPDLVILDYGTNDFLYGEQIPYQLGRQIVQTINWIRQLAPQASIILTSTQDMYRRGANIEAAKEFSQMIRRIAREQHCGLYDWYRISGGQYAISKWVTARLAREDYIHLTKNGYMLKGKLFAEAFTHTLARYAENAPDSIVMTGLPGIETDSVIARSEIAPMQMMTTRHKIRSGETLSEIADRYNVRVDAIMRRNHMSSSRIVAGHYLIVDHMPLKPQVVRTSKPVAAAPKVDIKNDPSLIRYKVVSGDTLGHIAERYHVSVKELKRLNGLSSSRIVEGKILLIRASSN